MPDWRNLVVSPHLHFVHHHLGWKVQDDSSNFDAVAVVAVSFVGMMVKVMMMMILMMVVVVVADIDVVPVVELELDVWSLMEVSYHLWRIHVHELHFHEGWLMPR